MFGTSHPEMAHNKNTSALPYASSSSETEDFYSYSAYQSNSVSDQADVHSMAAASSQQAVAQNDLVDTPMANTTAMSHLLDNKTEHGNNMASKIVKRGLQEEGSSEADKDGAAQKAPHRTSQQTRPAKKKSKTAHADQGRKSVARLFEPSDITVGRLRDQPEVLIYAQMHHRLADSVPFIRFGAGVRPPGKNFNYDQLWFDVKYWRGSLTETKEYIRSLFTLKTSPAGISMTLHHL